MGYGQQVDDTHPTGMHSCFQNGYGFQMNGGYEYVDLGDWSNETCFVDVDNCQEGIFH